MLKRVALALLLQLATLSAFAASPIRLTLALDPPETLPGIPVSFRIEAMNTSSSTSPMPKAMVLEVTPRDGDPYLTAMGVGRQRQFAIPFHDKNGAPIMLPGNGSQRFDFVAGPDTPPWRYGRFWREPGVYKLLIADDGLTVPLSGNAIALDSELLVGPVVSNTAVLTILTPTGADLEVWKLIEARDDPFWVDALADAVWQAYPNSFYAAYTFRKAPGDTAKQIEYVAAALAKNPRGAYGDWYRISIASEYYSLAEGTVRDDLPRAFEHSEAARRLLDEVIQRNVDPAAVQKAKDEIEKWSLSYEELKDYSERLRGAARGFCERLLALHERDSITRYMKDRDTAKSTSDALADVLVHIEKFATEVAKTPPSLSSALASLKVAIMTLESARDHQLIDDEHYEGWASTLVDAAEVAAEKAIDDDATDSHLNAAKLASARAKLQEARVMADDKDFKGAVNRFKDALNDAQEASKARPDPC
jgi:hypothetical protein